MGRAVLAAWRRSLLGESHLAALLGSVLMTYLGLGLIIPIRVLYARDVGLSLAEIGAMASGFLLTNTLGQVPFGWLTDRSGRKTLIVAGMVMQAAITLAYLITVEPWAFIGLRALEGVGAAALTPAARAYVADVTPPNRHGEAYGLLGAAFNGGILIGPAVGGWLAAVAGYNATFVLSAAGRLLSAGLVLLFVREPAGHRSADEVGATPEQRGWRPLVSRALAGGYAMSFGLGFASGLFFALWSIWLADRGASLGVIGLTYTAFALPSLVLTPVGGWLADRVHRLPMIIAPGLVDALIYLGYGFAGSVVLVVILCLLQGVLYAFILPALDAYIAAASPAVQRGRVQGVYMGSSLFGSFISAMLCTILYGWHPLAPFVLLSAVVSLTLAGGALLAMQARRPVVSSTTA